MFGVHKLIPILKREDAVAMATLVDISGGSSKRLGARAVWLNTSQNQRVGEGCSLPDGHGRRHNQPVANGDFDDHTRSDDPISFPSTPQNDGRFVGSLTAGGCVDSEAATIASRVAESGIPETVIVNLGDDGLDFGMSCAGSVTVFVEPIAPIRKPLLEVLGKVLEENAVGRTGSIALRLDDGLDRYAAIARNTSSAGLPQSVAEAAAHGHAQLIRSAESTFFIEGFARPPRLIVVGASPIADPLVGLGKMVGFDVVVVASRPVSGDRFEVADEVHCGMPSEICSKLELDSGCSVVITAHDYKHEVPVLRDLASRELAYLGFVASRRRGAAVLDFLRTTGSDLRAVQSITVPVGLDIGAVTPEEIAVSITAELLAAQNGRKGGSMQHSINDYMFADNK